MKAKSNKVVVCLGLAAFLVVGWWLFLDRYWGTDRGPIYTTERKLSELNLLLAKHYAERGKCPTPEKGLDEILLENPALKADALLDVWGARFGYSVTPNRLFCQVYSIGQNGIDEHMKGDDIFLVSETK